MYYTVTQLFLVKWFWYWSDLTSCVQECSTRSAIKCSSTLIRSSNQWLLSFEYWGVVFWCSVPDSPESETCWHFLMVMSGKYFDVWGILRPSTLFSREPRLSRWCGFRGKGRLNESASPASVMILTTLSLSIAHFSSLESSILNVQQITRLQRSSYYILSRGTKLFKYQAGHRKPWHMV